ncbi:hypothetical protein LH495_29655, partial [Klebsiella pneumoniae]|uniref:Rap1a/Tai family immunity protein n=1 Tax=Klebsiella pneumoniae TaxID=573 RepID=UPI001E43D03F
MIGLLLAAGLSGGAIYDLPPALAAPAKSFVDGNRLWDLCGRTTEGTPPDQCIGYVMGIADGLLMLPPDYRAFDTFRCAPPNVTSVQATDVVRRYLAEHPAYRSAFGPGLVASAFS